MLRISRSCRVRILWHRTYPAIWQGSSTTVDVCKSAGMHNQCGVGEDARGCPWSSSKKVEAARCAAAHSEEHSPTCDPAPNHITPPLVERRQTVHALAPHGEGPRRVSCTERLGPVSYMLCAGPDNRATHRKPPVRRDSVSPRSNCRHPLSYKQIITKKVKSEDIASKSYGCSKADSRRLRGFICF